MIRFSLLLLFVALMGNNKQNQYFQFDTIEYYHINVTNGYLDTVMREEHPTVNEQIMLGLFFYDHYPTNIREANKLNLTNAGYAKQDLTAEEFALLKGIFSKHDAKHMGNPACAAVYRDILVFKNDGTITGFVKICFTCNQHYILGSKYNTDNFGQSGEFTKLGKILLKDNPR